MGGGLVLGDPTRLGELPGHGGGGPGEDGTLRHVGHIAWSHVVTDA